MNRKGCIYKEIQRNVGKGVGRGGGRSFSRQYVRGVGRVERQRFVAEMSVNGHRYRFRSTNYYNVCYWLTHMREKYGEA